LLTYRMGDGLIERAARGLGPAPPRIAVTGTSTDARVHDIGVWVDRARLPLPHSDDQTRARGTRETPVDLNIATDVAMRAVADG
jgi:hypothetical protein